MKVQVRHRSVRHTALLLLSAAMVVGCSGNSGNRTKSGTNSKVYYGPGSTGATAPVPSGSTGGSGSTSGGSTAMAGQFNNGPDLNAARGQHTATLMTDGRVLVVGGTDGQGLMADSELFDPVANAWEVARNISPTPNEGLMMDPTGQFPTARQLHTAVALQDGRVLIAGGLGVERMSAQAGAQPQPVFEPMKTAYVFNPASNTFTPVDELPAARAWHLAAPLGNGNAALAGGLDANLASTKTADVFNAQSNTWSTVNMADRHTWGAMVPVGADAIVVDGADVQQTQQGLQIAGFPNQKAELFVSSTGAFTSAPNNIGDRIFLGAAPLSSGEAFLAGGQGLNGNSLDVVDTTERYDPAAQQFVTGPTMSVARFDCQIAEIGSSGDQLIVGGIDAQGGLLVSCEVWSGLNNAIVGTVDMSVARSDFRAVTLQDGRILVVGGLDDQGAGIAQTELHSR